MSTNTASIRRRPKWHHHHPPPPPTPKILHFPRRPRRRSSSSSVLKVPSSSSTLPTLETLFHREERACPPPPPPQVVVFGRRRRGERVLGRRRTETSTSVAFVEDEDEDNNNKWKFEAEMLRAECNLLRMQKDIALKKLHRTRSNLHTTLTSSLNSLLSGRMKISEGGNTDIEMVLDEEIRHLTEKLQRLHKRSGRALLKDSSQATCRSNTNFDKQVSVLQTRLDKIGGGPSDEIHLREFQEMQNVTLSIKKTSGRIDNDSLLVRGKLNVEILRRKMEGLSKGILLQRMEEEYNSLLSTATTSLASSASTSKRIEFQDSSSSTREKVCGEGNLCSGHCKSIVRRIVEQVRAETEQWSQMQEMLAQVREEMEQLQASRHFWEDRAHHSHFQIHSLHNSVQEWRERALSSESKTKELEAKISVLSGDLERLRKEKNNSVNATKCSRVQLETQNELEKRVVVCCSKENTHVMDNNAHIIENSSKLNKEVALGGIGERRGAQATIGGVLATKRLPFRDIGNSTMNMMLLMRQNGKAVFPLQSHLSSNADKKIMY